MNHIESIHTGHSPLSQPRIRKTIFAITNAIAKQTANFFQAFSILVASYISSNHISCDDTEQEYNKQHCCIIAYSHYQHQPFTGILIVVAIAVATATDITANGAKNNAPASARIQLISLKNIHLFHLSAKIFTFLNGSHT